MAVGDQKDWYEALKRGAAFYDADTTELKLVEVLRYRGVETAQWSERMLDDTTLESLFGEGMPRLGDPAEPRRPSYGLRLIICDCDWMSKRSLIGFTITKETFSVLNKHLHLHENFVKLVTSSHTRGFPTVSQNSAPTSKGFLLKTPFFMPNFFQIEVCHDLKTNLTYAFMVIRRRSRAAEIMMSRLRENEGMLYHPLGIPLQLAEIRVEDSQVHLSDAHAQLDELEESMGQHDYAGRPVGNPLELDFLSTTRTLNSIGHKIAFDILRLRELLLALEKMGSCVFKRPDLNSTVNGKQQAEVLQSGGGLQIEGSAAIAQKIDFVKDSCTVLVLEAEYEEKRVRALIQVVYQFMAQKDAKVNIGLAENSATIAKASLEDSAAMRVLSKASSEDSAAMRTLAAESKKDSAAMKTISILGMFFLPGTFVAALFAMPVFNWEGEGAPRINSGFKYYWAVAIPLTICVLGIWTLSMVFPWRRWFSNFLGPSKDNEEVELQRIP